MICTNEKCNKNFEEPLELYDGSWACPFCKREISDALQDFKITPESNELFILAERNYFTWLTSSPDDRAKIWNKSIGKAVELCKRAALLGDPRAITRLGYYYDKDYVEIERTEAERCRIAYYYYAAVCYSDSAQNIDAEKWQAIREYAARLMLNMLRYAPAEITDLPKFNFEANRNRVDSVLGIKIGDDGYETKKISRSERMLETFYSCFSTTRAPLFGICRITGEELADVFATSKANADADGRQSVYDLINHGLKICYVASSEIATGKMSFYKLSGESNINKRLDELKNSNAQIHVFFFNRCGKHRFFNGGSLNAIGRALEERNYNLVGRLLDGNKDRDYTFFDDDVYRYKGKFLAPIKTAVEELIETLRIGGTK